MAHDLVHPPKARRGDRIAVLPERHARLQTHFLERAVAPVAKQEAAYGIVGHEYVGKTIAVKIGKGHAHAFADVLRDARGLRHIGEGAVVVVVK